MKAIPGFNAETSVYRVTNNYLSVPGRAYRYGSQQVIPQRDTGTTGGCVIWYYHDVNYPGQSWPVLICW